MLKKSEVPEYAMKAYRGSGGASPLFLDLRTRCRRVCYVTPLQLEIQEGPPLTVEQHAGRGLQPVWTMWKREISLLPLLGFECLIVHPCSSLYSVYAVQSPG
jgi:hypothetical protein